MNFIFALALSMSASAAAQPLEWRVTASSTAAFAKEVSIVYRGAPAGFKADAERSGSNALVVVKTVESAGAWTWTLLPLSTGALTFVAHYRAADEKTASAPPVALLVSEADLPNEADISEIKAPLDARPALWPWLLAALAAAAGWYGWKRWRGRARPSSVGPAAPAVEIPPEDAAMRAISELLASGLWENDQAAYYLRLTDILRAYLEARYDEPVTAMTSVEVARLVRERAQDLRIGTQVRDILARADLVKFAKAKPEPEDGLRDADLALALIRATTRRVDAPEKDKP
jgi:hypothetical protein